MFINHHLSFCASYFYLLFYLDKLFICFVIVPCRIKPSENPPGAMFTINYLYSAGCCDGEARWDLVTVSRTNFCFEMNLGKVPRQSLIKQPEEYKKTLDQAGKYTSHSSHSTQCRETKHQVREVYIFFYFSIYFLFLTLLNTSFLASSSCTKALRSVYSGHHST